MNKYIIYSVSALALASSMASCSNDEDFGAAGAQSVELTVVAGRGGDAVSRTAFENQGGSLLCTWDDDDQLVVFNAAGTKLGVLDIDPADNGKATATFTGKITVANGEKINLYYLGNGKTTEVATEYTIDLSAQGSTIADLAANDFLRSTEGVAIVDGKATVNTNLKREVAEGYFNLALPDGVTLEKGDFVTISASTGTLNAKATANLSQYNLTPAAGTITVTMAEAGNSFYVTMLPTAALAPKFEVRKDGMIYTATLGNHEWTPETFVRANENGDPVEVTNWDKKEVPTDPGDLGNWGGTVDYPSLQGSGSLSKVGASKDAWCSNERSFQDFGFAAPYTFPYNAIKNGILTSNSWTNGEEARFFQWGRWLGFPRYVENAEVTMLAYGASGTVAYARGVNQNTYQSYYSWDMDSRPTYAYSTAWNSGMEKQQAINSSIIFLCANNDYLKSAYSNLSWQERSGNPCPDGYRIPTADEMYVFVPETGLDSEGEFSGSHAEVKVVNGQKYAVKWTVNSSDKSVSVVSVPTTEDNVTVDSSVFADATPIKLSAKGFLYSENAGVGMNETLTDGTYVGGYWTSDLYEEDPGNALCVMVYINGNKCQVALDAAPLTWGLCIMPIHDSKAKATSIKPWFPLGY